MSSLVRVPAVSIGGVVVAVDGDQLFAGGSLLCPENAEQLAKRAGFENAAALSEAIEQRPEFALIDTRDSGHGVELFETEAEAIAGAVARLVSEGIASESNGLFQFSNVECEPFDNAGEFLEYFQDSCLGFTEFFHVVPIRKAVTQ